MKRIKITVHETGKTEIHAEIPDMEYVLCGYPKETQEEIVNCEKTNEHVTCPECLDIIKTYVYYFTLWNMDNNPA